jgi:hypothetical protein
MRSLRDDGDDRPTTSRSPSAGTGDLLSQLPGVLAASARQFGISTGVAVTGSIVASTGAGFINSSHAAWAVLGGCGLGGCGARPRAYLRASPSIASLSLTVSDLQPSPTCKTETLSVY